MLIAAIVHHPVENRYKYLAALSQLTVWTADALQETLSYRQHIFLAYLRLYLLPQPVPVPVHPKGLFVPLPHLLSVPEASPVLSDRTFAQRQHQLENREPPLHAELEQLQGALIQLSADNPAAKELDQDISIFLGWGSDKPPRLDSDLVWIQKIAEVGNSSDGHSFEKLVRRSLIKLGFTNSNRKPEASLDPNATGGAGGLDFYCEAPYPVVGECKATKTETVPDGTPAQLIKLGYKHLQEQYDRCIKLIAAAGELTPAALLTAIGNKISVIRPETLQSIVEMQAKHRGSINLMELKKCLQDAYGLADGKVEQYLTQIRKDIEVRSHLVQVLKKYQQEKGLEAVGVERLCGVYDASNPPITLTEREMHETLIELSSPLTGYLGRIKASDWLSDRFYFLRDLA